MLCILLFSSLVSFSQDGHKVTFQLNSLLSADKSNVEITILNFEKLPSENKNGTIIFNNVPKGNYQASVNGEGIAPKIISFLVNNDVELKVDVYPVVKNLGDVTVNSNKRDINLISAPSSITSLSSKQLKEMRVWELSDLSGLSPNFYLANSGDNRNVTSIRGITTTSYEQAVVTYIDGVAQFNLDTYIPQLANVDHVEIIRGTQGTLYGRNAMGGIINITTKKPVNRTTGYADLQLGNFGQQRYAAGFNTALIKDKMFASVSLLHDKKSGYYTNTLFNEKYDKQEQSMLDIQLRYYFKHNWSILANHKQYAGRNNGAFPLVTDLKALFETPYTLAQNQLAQMRDNSSNSSISLKHRAKGFDLNIQTAYQRNYRYYDKTLDADFSPADIVGIFNNYGKNFNTVEIFSNELRLQSYPTKQNTKLEWTAGLFQFIQRNPGRQATVFGNDAGFIGVPDANFAVISNNDARNSGFAGYGNLDFKITPKITLSGGLRIDNENRSLTVSGEYEKQPMQPIVTKEPETGRTSYNAFSPKFGIQYMGSTSFQLFANYARGFRSGGLSGLASDPSQIPLSPYLPEYSNMFELGAKGINKKQIFRYSATIFYNNVSNIQTPLLLLPDALTLIQNAGKLRSFGIELEVMAQLAKGLTLQYTGGLTDAKYKKLDGVNDGNQIDLSGNKQVFTPGSNHFIGLQYQRKIGKIDWSIRTDYIQTGKQYFDLANQIAQDAYGVLNMRSSLHFSNFELSIWARNVTGAKFIDYAYDFGAAHLGKPRTWGLGINYKLN